MKIKSYEKRTRYNAEQKNKCDNFTYMNENYCKKGQTVIVGDSITDFYNDNELFCQYRRESGKELYNRGISGDISNRLLERLHSNVLSAAPRNLIVLIGTNDIAKGASAEYIVSNIAELISRTREECPECRIAVQSVYPVINHRQRKNKQIIELNILIRALCGEKSVTYIDLYDSLCDETGSLNKKYTYDGLHLNVLGYEIVTAALLEFIKSDT